MRNTVISRIFSEAGKNKDIFVISGDAGYGVLDEFRGRYKERFLNLGLAEQNTIGFAAGLSLVGFKVFLYNIIPFLLYRSYEQVRNDICYQRLPVVFIGLGSGITYGMQGMTHYSVEDIAIGRTCPNLVIISPADPVEARAAIDFSFTSKAPVYIRIAKAGEPAIHKKPAVDITKPLLVREGNKVAVLFHGSIVGEVLKAVECLPNTPRVISVPMLQPLDFDCLSKMLKGIETIITVEEHFRDGGLGSIIADWILEKGFKFSLKKLGISHEFIHAVKNNAGLRGYYGINSHAIEAAIACAMK